MQKIIIFFLLVVATVVKADEPDVKLHQKCIYPTVLITNGTCDHCKGFGSGVIIRSEKISDQMYLNVALSCDHVTRGAHQLNVHVFGYKDWSVCDGSKSFIYPAYCYDSDPVGDLSVVFFKSNKILVCADIDLNEKVYDGSDVIGVGCAFMEPPRIDYGKITGISEKYYRTNVQTINGDSGGPLFHNYKLIGLKRAIKVYNLDEGLGIPVFGVSLSTQIANFTSWNKQNDNLYSFVLNPNNKLPKLPLLILNAREFKNKN